MGAQWMLLSAIEKGWLQRPDKTPLESVFYSPFEELAYVVGLHLINNIT